MMATVPHVISGMRLRKFQADGFLLTRLDNLLSSQYEMRSLNGKFQVSR